MEFSEAIKAYNQVLEWDSESANELLEAIIKVRDSGYRLLLSHLQSTLRELSYRTEVPSHYSTQQIGEPILAIDRKGDALVGTLQTLHVEALRKQTPSYRNGNDSRRGEARG